MTASALGRKTMFSSMSARTADEAGGDAEDAPSSDRKVRTWRVDRVMPRLVLQAPAVMAQATPVQLDEIDVPALPVVCVQSPRANSSAL